MHKSIWSSEGICSLTSRIISQTLIGQTSFFFFPKQSHTIHTKCMSEEKFGVFVYSISPCKKLSKLSVNKYFGGVNKAYIRYTLGLIWFVIQQLVFLNVSFKHTSLLIINDPSTCYVPVVSFFNFFFYFKAFTSMNINRLMLLKVLIATKIIVSNK